MPYIYVAAQLAFDPNNQLIRHVEEGAAAVCNSFAEEPIQNVLLIHATNQRNFQINAIRPTKFSTPS